MSRPPRPFVGVLALVALLAALTLACGPSGEGGPPRARATAAAPTEAEAAFGELPARFRGELPSAECDAQRIDLELLPGEVFFASTLCVRKGEGARVDTLGRYEIEEEGQVLRLEGSGEYESRWRIAGPEELFLPDHQAGEVDTGPDASLARDAELEPLSPSLEMLGKYSYYADAARFVECASGLDMPVAMVEDHAALERAYLEAEPAPGQPLLAALEGRIERRPPMEGEGRVPTLIVERFVRLEGDALCPDSGPGVSLLRTRWELRALGASSVGAEETMETPHIVLEGVEQRVFGSSGCNRLSGGFSIEGERIRFDPLAMTRRACPRGAEIEAGLGRVFEQARSWRIEGEELIFLDEQGAGIARFVSAGPASLED